MNTLTTPLMERLSHTEKWMLSKILGRPTTMEEAAQAYNQRTSHKVTSLEVAEYFKALKEKREKELIIALHNNNQYRLRELRRQMWWKHPEPATSAYKPQSEEDKLKAENLQLRLDLAYARGYADAAKLSLQALTKGTL